MAARKRYVLVGTGGRGLGMFAKPILENFSKFSELVGLFDHNRSRLDAANDLLGTRLPVFTNWNRMLREAKPDAVIVASRDSTHARYIVKALDAGLRAISEKPLCVDAKQAREILAAEKRNARKKNARCFVTHNMRYGPAISELKRLLKSGLIGEVKAMNFHENLDRKHGADYFRRWHRVKKNSGGLLIHKSSHHFDVLNWLADSVPDELVAQGGLTFYGKNGPFRAKRCSGCKYAKKCDFYADLWGNERNRKLYKDAEKDDGYIRDGCVFDKEIDIEDHAGVLYTYKNGIRVTYSLTAFASYEGWHIQFEGTEGRLELKDVHDTRWAAGNVTVHGLEKSLGKSLLLYSPKKGFKNLPIPTAQGGHGGADPQIQHDFFGRPFDAKPTPRMAPLDQAVQAVLIGHAANVSMAKNSKLVKVQEFLKRG